MAPALNFASLSCVVLACGGGCFESKSTPYVVPVVVPVEKPAEAPVEAQAPGATAGPEVAQAPDAAR